MTQSGRFNHSWSIFMRPKTQLCCMTYLQADSGACKPPWEVHLFRGTKQTGKNLSSLPAIQTIQMPSCCCPGAGCVALWIKKVVLPFPHCKFQIPLHQHPLGDHHQNGKIKQVLHPLRLWFCVQAVHHNYLGALVKMTGTEALPNLPEQNSCEWDHSLGFSHAPWEPGFGVPWTSL